MISSLLCIKRTGLTAHVIITDIVRTNIRVCSQGARNEETKKSLISPETYFVISTLYNHSNGEDNLLQYCAIIGHTETEQRVYLYS